MAKAKTYYNSSSSSDGGAAAAAAATSTNNSSNRGTGNLLGGGGDAGRRNEDEQHGLLSGDISDNDDDDGDSDDGSSENGFVVHPGDSDGSASPDLGGGRPPHNHSHNHSSKPKHGRIPSNTRVRFDLRPTNIPPPANGNGHSDSGHDHFNNNHHDFHNDEEEGEEDRRASRDDFEDFDIDDVDYDPARTARRPLLTDIEAPSVALANDDELWEGDAEAEAARAERERPRSGLRPAFMNMANSIIGAGIIGQPYALRQAGLVGGVVLLLSLTVVVDWTIRLIVVNSKLSGAGSFQGTVERCFGRPGLVAISLAQWLFAFGGMVAFGVIVGDSIPPVIRTVWPGIEDVPVLSVFAGRRAVIVVCVLGVSYPLTLYRDISKVRVTPSSLLIRLPACLASA